MSVGGILESLQQSLGGGPERSLVFRADGDFSSTLTLGQIIKGKVLRHYDGGRYGISFNGQERVVDSTFPMHQGDVIYARVTGLDEKVHLQRVVGDPVEQANGKTDPQRSAHLQGVSDYRDTIQSLFYRYQAKLTTGEHRLIRQLQAQLGGSRHVALSALILHKIGIAIDAGLIKALHRVLADLSKESTAKQILHQASLATETGNASAEEMVEGLAALLSSVSRKGRTEGQASSAMEAYSHKPSDHSELQTFLPDSHMGQGREKEHLEWFLGQWLLNAQVGGAVSHRFMRIPLWFDGQLVEVTLALFAQGATSEEKASEDRSALRYRRIVFSLETERLGRLEIQAKLADCHVCLDICADSRATAEYLGIQMKDLRMALAAYGWQIDDIRYGVLSAPGGPLDAVIEHLVAKDSLNRLM